MRESSFSRCLTYIEAQERSPRKSSKQAVLPAITISREAGAGATSVATRVATLLEIRPEKRGAPWTVFDQNLVEKVLQDHNLPDRIHRFMPEDARPAVTGALEEMLGLHPSSWTLQQHTVDTIYRLALLGNVIVIGRGGSIITSQMRHVLHVRLIAPREVRIQRFCKDRGLTHADADKLVQQLDNARRRYLKSHFNADISDPLQYDLLINTGKVDFDQAAEMIAGAVQKMESADLVPA